MSGDNGANVPMAEVVLRFTTTGLLASVALPAATSNVTVIVPDATPAVSDCGEVVNANWLAAAEVTVSS